jgi:hypothetical protein
VKAALAQGLALVLFGGGGTLEFEDFTHEGQFQVSSDKLQAGRFFLNQDRVLGCTH